MYDLIKMLSSFNNCTAPALGKGGLHILGISQFNHTLLHWQNPLCWHSFMCYKCYLESYFTMELNEEIEATRIFHHHVVS